MPRPTKIRHPDGRKGRIIWRKKLQKGRYGEALLTDGHIEVSLAKCRNNHAKAMTLTHELGHFWLSSLGLDDDVEERVCEALEKHLASYAPRNYDLLVWILDSLVESPHG